MTTRRPPDRRTDAGPDGTLLARFDRPTATRPRTIAVVADPHVPPAAVDSAKLFEPAEMLRSVVADCNRRDVDGVVVLGDLTKDGEPDAFDRFERILDGLRAPFWAIPGNHDVPKTFDSHEGLDVSAFTRRYAPGRLPFVASLEGCSIVGLDSASGAAVADSHDGTVSPRQVAWLDDALADTTAAFVFVHHNLPGAVEQVDEYRREFRPDLGRPPVLRAPDDLVTVLREHDVPLVFSGHLHIPAVATTRGIREVVAPSTCTFPPAYLLVECTETGTAVRYVPLATVRETQRAYVNRRELKPKARALTAMASARLSAFPLVDEHNPGVDETVGAESSDRS